MEEIEFLVDDQPVTLEFWITPNTVTLYFPDGSNRLTSLNGLDVCDAVRL